MRCRFCKSHKIKRLFLANKLGPKIPEIFACTNCGFGSHGPIVECHNCGIIYVDETISQRQISTYYEVAHDPEYFREQPARAKTFSRYLRRLKVTFPHPGRLLDVGTNTGLFVKIAKDSGWNAIGIEPNKWAVDYAWKNYRVKLVNKPFGSKVFPQKSFDVITMWDVIEHFTNPVGQIAAVFSLLKPGGVFAFSTVDPKSIFAQVMGTNWSWYMEMHRVFLTRKCARRYLIAAGFTRIVFRPHIRFLSLRYLATRLAAINPVLAKVAGLAIKALQLERTVVPYFANDLYDCYAIR